MQAVNGAVDPASTLSVPGQPVTKSPSSTVTSPLVPPHPLASSRYNRQLLIPSISLPGQLRIASARVLVVGLGGLGSPAALYLAGAGIHTLGLVDDDVVEESNLHRQIVHREDSVRNAWSKVRSAERAVKELNGGVQVKAYEGRFSGGGSGRSDGHGSMVERVFEDVDWDVVLDCTDNPATRYAINDVCVALRKCLVSGAAQVLSGQLMVLNYEIPDDDPCEGGGGGSSGAVGVEGDRGPCYRCVFPRPPPPEMVRGCSEVGILGPVVGVIGTLMAGEALRVVVEGVEYGRQRKPSMLLYSAWAKDPRMVWRSVGLRGRRADCVACGNEAVVMAKGGRMVRLADVVDGTMDYGGFCGVEEEVGVLGAEERMDAREFFEAQAEKKGRGVVVDVRERHEVEIGAKVDGSVNIPISRILREGFVGRAGEGDEEMQRVLGERDGPVYFVCQRGNDSQIAARKLMDLEGGEATEAGDMGKAKAKAKRWIGDVKGGFVAMEKVVMGQ